MRDPVEIEKEIDELCYKVQDLKLELEVAKLGANVGDILTTVDYDNKHREFHVESLDGGLRGTMIIKDAFITLHDPFLKWEKIEHKP